MSPKLLWNESSDTRLDRLKNRLSQWTRLQLDLKINDNRSTMLSLLDRRRNYARVSLHHIFVEAPDPVLAALAAYVRGKPNPEDHRTLRAYIQTSLRAQDYRHRLKSEALVTQGQHYDLQALFNQLEERYFPSGVEAQVTWYGRAGPARRTCRRITYGAYVDSLKLIKIHRRLDDPFFPLYFVTFVLYHEMLHAVIPGTMNARGQFCVHHKEFKRREREFHDYTRAMAWESQHLPRIFGYGRT